MRFIRIACLLAFIALTCVTAEKLILAYVPAKYVPYVDLAAHYGPGQSMLYIISLACIALFVWLSKREEAQQKTPPLRSPVARSLSAYKAQKDRVVRGFLAGLIPALTVTTVGYIGLVSMGGITWKPNVMQLITPGVILQTTLSLLVVVVLTTTEELIFRGFLFNYLYTQKKPAVAAGAVIVSSLIFASVHKFRNPADWLEPHNWPLFITLFMLGSLLCLTYMTGESLACSIGVHTGILLPEVFRNQSHLMELHQEKFVWLGTHNDIRTAPVTWGLLLSLAVILWINKARLNAIARIADTSTNAEPEPQTAKLPSAESGEGVEIYRPIAVAVPVVVESVAQIP